MIHVPNIASAFIAGICFGAAPYHFSERRWWTVWALLAFGLLNLLFSVI